MDSRLGLFHHRHPVQLGGRRTRLCASAAAYCPGPLAGHHLAYPGCSLLGDSFLGLCLLVAAGHRYPRAQPLSAARPVPRQRLGFLRGALISFYLRHARAIRFSGHRQRGAAGRGAVCIQRELPGGLVGYLRIAAP